MRLKHLRSQSESLTSDMENGNQLEPQTGPRPRPRAMLCLALASTALLWIVFVAGVPAQELVVGALCAAAFTAFIFSMWRAQGEHLALRVCDVLEIRQVPAQIVRDAFLVIRILFGDLLGTRPAESLYIVHAFDACARDPQKIDGRKLAREVLAVAYMTASPNSIVLGIHQERSLMLMHQLAKTPLPAMARELGAGDQP